MSFAIQHCAHAAGRDSSQKTGEEDSSSHNDALGTDSVLGKGYEHRNSDAERSVGDRHNEHRHFEILILTKRCLIPADGFYEWRKMGSVKQPYALRWMRAKSCVRQIGG
jgi:hypothetical protein